MDGRIPTRWMAETMNQFFKSSPVGAVMGHNPGDIIHQLGDEGWYRVNVSDLLQDYLYGREIDWGRVRKHLEVFQHGTCMASARASWGDDKKNPKGWPTEDQAELRMRYVQFWQMLELFCGDLIHGYQIGNELHWKHQWPIGRYSELASLVRDCRAIISEEDDSAFIALGGFSAKWLLDNPEVAIPRTIEILNAFDGSEFDAFDLHCHFPYDRWRDVAGGILEFRAVHWLSATKPCIMSENATWSGDPPGDDPYQSRLRQAMYTYRTIPLALRFGTKAVTGGCRKDDDWGGNGLFDVNDRMKLSGKVVKYFIQQTIPQETKGK